ncbi:carbohydrate ABC transporter substrate-binding protein, CUT1 family [Thermanaeromonas toyohensis ToBE]|uniref:Carbohydrate ABC transporter substrate-binding protein, CUT1 family n=1 Tax=Thermanaeromonas toyohensis ToBE TaxID=698762 RepID=A0A1W1VVI0_9FIRM|nr:ABC transporter substrate-binding protein [Thermanaeromonas toyohensis]SMB97369.1 carbohydrate ABC transporter substrate-binding protein, CUT1 family [Thermanaeromonas toyohensis ToBE]
MKRSIKLIILAITFTLLSIIAGCAKSPSQAGKPEEKPKITIVHWQHHHEARTPVVQELAREFEQSHPGVSVVVEPIPYDSYFDKLYTSLASGSGPDTFQIAATMALEMINGGKLAPMPDSIYTPEQVKNTFLAWTVEPGFKDGKYYGLPTDVQTLVLFINNEIFKSIGGDPQNPPKTWSEMEKYAIAATKKDASGKMVQAGLDTRYKWAVYTAFLYQNIEGPVVDVSAKKVNYDSPQGLAAWNFVHKLMVQDKVDSPEFMTGQFKFELKKALFYINHPVTRGRIEKMAPGLDYSVAQLPMPDGKPGNITVGHSWMYVVNKDSKNAKVAWEWVKFLASKEAQIKWITKAGDLPSMKALLEDEALWKDPKAQVVRESLKYARPCQEVGENDVNKIRNEIWDNIVLKGMKVEEAVKEGAQKENALIAQKLK